jgi:hypothetical protein
MNVTEHRQGTVRFGMLGWAREQPRRQLWIENNGWIDIEMVKTFSKPLSQQQNPERVGPIRKPGVDVLEKHEVKSKRPSMWNIVFYNDDYTSMEFVVFVLTKVFHRSTEDALALTFAVHTPSAEEPGSW